MTDFVDRLQADLIRDEGLREKPYTDTVGKLTIGVGRNLDDVGISRAEAIHLLRNDMARVFADLDANLPWWRQQPEPVRLGLANMCFNLGWPRLSRFKNMLSSLKAECYEAAAKHALDSKWARQVGKRAERIAALYRQAEKQRKG